MKTKIRTAAVSATQATTASVSMSIAATGNAIARFIAMPAGVRPSIIAHIARDLAARVCQHFGGNSRPGSGRGGGTMPPLPNNHYDQSQTYSKRDGREQIGEPIEAAHGRRGQHRFAILLHERFQDRVVRFATDDPLVDLLELALGHFAGARKSRAGMAARSGR